MAKEKEKEKESRRIVLFVAVASRGQGEKIATYCAGCGGKIRLIALGRGTASQDILNYLGLGDSKKDVVFCTASRPAAQKMLDGMRRRFSMKNPGEGIAFTVPVSSVVGRVSFDLLFGEEGMIR